MSLVLSTKILNASQKRHLFAAGIDLVEYNAVQIKPLEPNLKKSYFENAIFTSQNAVKLAINQNIKVKNAFCIGDKTSALLRKNNIQLMAKATHAKELANEIVENHPEKSFDFFCSRQRRDELPEILNKNNIKLNEHHLYESVSNFKKFSNAFDAVLCFSPLGIKAYYEIHTHRPPAICIGLTTVNAAKQYTEKVYQASKTSIESVVIKAIKTFSPE